MKSSKKKIIFFVGPTGVGKTQVSLAFAKLMPCEFISADSMQVYKHMDIVTDKMPQILRREYPCHLLDVVEPTVDFNVAEFYKMATQALKGICEKKKQPVVIGGTGLYVNTLLDGIFPGPGADKEMRKRLEAEVERLGLDSLYQKLKKLDAEAAAKINPHDKKRIIRALEVQEATQSRFSTLQKSRSGWRGQYEVCVFGLRRQREDLYQRIDQRVDFMVNAGLLDEVRGLLKKKLSSTAYFCIGIREMESFLKGEIPFDEAVSLIKRNSRRFAKRQMTWFNRLKDVEWLDVLEGEDLAGVADKIFERVF